MKKIFALLMLVMLVGIAFSTSYFVEKTYEDDENATPMGYVSYYNNSGNDGTNTFIYLNSTENTDDGVVTIDYATSSFVRKRLTLTLQGDSAVKSLFNYNFSISTPIVDVPTNHTYNITLTASNATLLNHTLMFPESYVKINYTSNGVVFNSSNLNDSANVFIYGDVSASSDYNINMSVLVNVSNKSAQMNQTSEDETMGGLQIFYVYNNTMYSAVCVVTLNASGVYGVGLGIIGGEEEGVTLPVSSNGYGNLELFYRASDHNLSCKFAGITNTADVSSFDGTEIGTGLFAGSAMGNSTVTLKNFYQKYTSLDASYVLTSETLTMPVNSTYKTGWNAYLDVCGINLTEIDSAVGTSVAVATDGTNVSNMQNSNTSGILTVYGDIKEVAIQGGMFDSFTYYNSSGVKLLINKTATYKFVRDGQVLINISNRNISACSEGAINTSRSAPVITATKFKQEGHYANINDVAYIIGMKSSETPDGEVTAYSDDGLPMLTLYNVSDSTAYPTYQSFHLCVNPGGCTVRNVYLSTDAGEGTSKFIVKALKGTSERTLFSAYLNNWVSSALGVPEFRFSPGEAIQMYLRPTSGGNNASIVWEAN